MHFQRKNDLVNNEGNGWKELKCKKEFYRTLRGIYSSWGGGGGREKYTPSFYFLKISNLDDILSLFHKISVN